MNFAPLKVGDVSGEAEVLADLSHRKTKATENAWDLHAPNLWLVLRSRDAEGKPAIYWLVESADDGDGYLILPSNRKGLRGAGKRFRCELPWSALEWIGSSHGVEHYPMDPVLSEPEPAAGLSQKERFKQVVAKAFEENKVVTVGFDFSYPECVARVYGKVGCMHVLLLKPDGALTSTQPATFAAREFSSLELAESHASIAAAITSLHHAGLVKA